MNIPHLKYIEALFLSFKNIPQILKELEEVGLGVSMDVLEVIEAGLQDYSPKTFVDQDADYPTKSFLDELGIAPLWSYLNNFPMDDVDTAPIEGAYKMLQDPIMFRIVTTAAIMGLNDEDKQFILLSDYNTEYEEIHLEVFLKYFFAVEMWSVKDKKEWIELHAHPELKSTYTEALKGDRDYIFWKLGVKRSLDYKHMLSDMSRDSYFLFKEYKDSTNPSEAQSWGKLAMQLADKIDKMTAKEKEGKTGSDAMQDIKFQIQTRIGKKYQEETPGETKNKKNTKKHKAPLGTNFKHFKDLEDDNE